MCPSSRSSACCSCAARQTPGELKQRTERWHTFRSLDDLEETLQRLAGRGFAQQLERRPGQKEARWITLIVSTDETAAPVVPIEATVEEPAEVASAPVVEPAPREERSLPVRNPATGAMLRDVAVTEEGEIAQKTDRARRAQRAWAARPYEERAELLRRFATMLDAEAEECARLTTSEVGKPIRQARNEISALRDRITWNVEHAGEVLAPRVVTPDTDSVVGERISYDPVGVVADISAWNYPYFVVLNSIVPALLAGNAVLYKPSEHATLTGLRIVDLFHRAGVPVDVVQAVVGGGAAGAALVGGDIDMVCFTGSYATGRKVAATAADRLLRVQLELGGKDAAYVCDDVDVESAAFAIAEGACYNGGQSCCAIERVYVHEAVFDRFVDALVQVVSVYRVGDPDDDATDIGPLARSAQLDVLDAQVGDAVGEGCAAAVRWRTDRAATGIGSSRPCWSTSTTVWRSCARRPSAQWCRSHACATTRTRSDAWTTPSSAWARPCSRTIVHVPSRFSPGSTSATLTGTHPTGRASACRGPVAGTRAMVCRCRMRASARSREKAWHLKTGP